MNRKYLGDSYDAVKRMWQDLLVEWAPLHVEPRFLPPDICEVYTSLTRIPILPNQPQRPYAILNDPDTGIRLPGEQNQRGGIKHISIETIIGQLRDGARCVITFDQSHYRHSELKRDEQRRAKMRRIAEADYDSFYYVSHAPFLFAFPDVNALNQVKDILQATGIPAERIEML